MTLETGKLYFFGGSRELVLPEAVSLFGFSVSFYGIFLVLAAILGILAVLREGKKRAQSKEWILAVLPLVIVSGVIGARIYYVAFQWHPFAEEPFLVFWLHSGGLAYLGALLGAWITVKLYCRRKKQSFERTADVLSIGASYAAVPVWLGCALMREPVGRFYDGFISVKISAEYLPKEADCAGIRKLLEHVTVFDGEDYISIHPVALYGAVAALVTVLVLWIAKRFIKKEGQLFRLYLLLNAGTVLLLENFRASSCCIWGTGFPMNSVVAGILFGTILLSELQAFRNRKRTAEKM